MGVNLVGDKNHVSTGGKLRRIMVPVGNKVRPDGGLRLAARMASGTDSELRLVRPRIWEPPMPGSGRFYRRALKKPSPTWNGP
jgi:hypothetical protein